MSADKSGIKKQTLVALASPFIVMAIYLLISRWPIKWWNGYTDFGAIGLSIVFGVFMLSRLPYSIPIRLGLILIGLPISAYILFWGSFVFVCAIFGTCL